MRLISHSPELKITMLKFRRQSMMDILDNKEIPHVKPGPKIAHHPSVSTSC